MGGGDDPVQKDRSAVYVLPVLHPALSDGTEYSIPAPGLQRGKSRREVQKVTSAASEKIKKGADKSTEVVSKVMDVNGDGQVDIEGI